MTLQFLGAKILGKHILRNKRKWAMVVCPIHFLLNAFATKNVMCKGDVSDNEVDQTTCLDTLHDEKEGRA